MGFFSELKNDLSQAVNTLMPDDSEKTATPDNLRTEEGFEAKVGKSEKVDIDSMLNRLDDIKLDDISNESEENVEEPEEEYEEPESVQNYPEPEPVTVSKPARTEAPKSALETIAELQQHNNPVSELDELEEKIEKQTEAEVKREKPQSALEAVEAYTAPHLNNYVAQTSTAPVENTNYNGGFDTMDFEQLTPTDETASITEGMYINGNVQTTGSLDLIGKVTGNIKCLGKLNVTGEIIGDSDAAEVYAESARITGEVRSNGSVKVGQSTVIVGNIFGSSAVIAGAVKGDIDVHGPVVLDTTAIVMGNIKSQSVQINNGAVIEGMCSQAYADVNPSEFFEQLKNR